MRRLGVGAALIFFTTLTVATGVAQDRSLARQGASPAETRLALVVGNNNYAEAPLKNAVNDAEAIADALRSVGFTVTLKENTKLVDLDRAVQTFATEVPPGAVAFFFYSGHGIQIGGENYLVPIDFAAGDEIGAKYAAFPAERVREALEAARARLTVLVLDACRNNPFRAVRSSSGGLASMQGGVGTLIAFATAPNRTASDNPGGRNGLFTTHLLEALKTPGLSLGQVFDRVRERVYEASNRQQVPWTVSSVIGDFVFVPPAPVVSPPPPPRPTPAPTAPASGPAAVRTLVFQSKVAELLWQVKPERTKEFEAAWTSLMPKLGRSTRASFAQAADGLRLFRVETSSPPTYVLRIDPVVADVSYQPGTLLQESGAFSNDDAQAVYRAIAESQVNLFSNALERIALRTGGAANDTGRAAAPRGSRQAAGKWTFAADRGEIIFRVKPGQGPAFEQVWQAIIGALDRSGDARDQQAAKSLALLKSAASADTYWLYVDEPVRDFSYDPVGLLYALFDRAAADDLYGRLIGAFETANILSLVEVRSATPAPTAGPPPAAPAPTPPAPVPVPGPGFVLRAENSTLRPVVPGLLIRTYAALHSESTPEGTATFPEYAPERTEGLLRGFRGRVEPAHATRPEARRLNDDALRKFRSGQFKDAAALLQRAYDVDADDPEITTNLADALLRTGDLAGAIRYGEQSVLLNLRRELSWRLLGFVYVKTGQHRLAVVALEVGYYVSSNTTATLDAYRKIATTDADSNVRAAITSFLGTLVR